MEPKRRVVFIFGSASSPLGGNEPEGRYDNNIHYGRGKKRRPEKGKKANKKRNEV